MQSAKLPCLRIVQGRRVLSGLDTQSGAGVGTEPAPLAVVQACELKGLPNPQQARTVCTALLHTLARAAVGHLLKALKGLPCCCCARWQQARKDHVCTCTEANHECMLLQSSHAACVGHF